MEADRTRARWTWAEFARLPSEGSNRYEVIAGELAVTPSPTPRHQKVVANLLGALADFVLGHDLGELLPGPVDVLFAPGDDLEPDLVFVGRRRSRLITDRGVEGPPGNPTPDIHPAGASFEWRPGPGAETLSVEVAELFRGVERLPGGG